MKTLKIILISLSIVVLSLGSLNALIQANTVSDEFSWLKEFEKRYFGGIVVNKTSHPIYITDWRNIIILPPGKSSRDIGVFDTDAVYISNNTKFDGVIYSSGVIKFCDLATLKIEQTSESDKVYPSFSYNICKVFNDAGWRPDLIRAFPLKY